MEIPTNSVYNTLIPNLAPLRKSEVKSHKSTRDTRSAIKMSLRRPSKKKKKKVKIAVVIIITIIIIIII
jgi:t-SNARE complex subunit (syntaxin)